MSVDKEHPGLQLPHLVCWTTEGKNVLYVGGHTQSGLKWSPLTENIIQVMRGICSQPEQVVSDNGSQFRV